MYQTASLTSMILFEKNVKNSWEVFKPSQTRGV